MVSIAKSVHHNGSALRESPANLSALHMKSKMIPRNAILSVSDSILSIPVSDLSIRKIGRIRFHKRTNLQRMLLSIALLAIGIAISSNPASGFSLRKVGRFHSRNRMIFEPGHEYSLPPRCWEVSSPERNEQEAVLYACVKSSTYNPSAAIPALADEDCPDSHWLSAHESRGQQANNPSAAIPALADKNCPDSKWLSVNNSRGQQAKENKNADSISLSKLFGIRGQQTDDSQWLSMINGIRGHHSISDLQRTSKEIRNQIHGNIKKILPAKQGVTIRSLAFIPAPCRAAKFIVDPYISWPQFATFPAYKGATSLNRSNYFNIQSIMWMPCHEGDNHHSHSSAKIVASFQCFVECSLLSNEGDERCQCIVASALTIFTFDNKAAEHIVASALAHPSASEGAKNIVVLFGAQPRASEGDMGMDDAVEIIFASAAQIPVFPRSQRLERRTRQPQEQHAERHAREPTDKCSTPPSHQSNIVVSSASRHSGKIIALTTASEGDQHLQMIVEFYPAPQLIVVFIWTSPNEGDKASATSRAKIAALPILGSSHLIVEYFHCPHCKFASQVFRSRQHRKPPAKFSVGLRTNCNSITSTSEGGNFDMARSISMAHYMPSTSESARNRLTSSLVRGTAMELATGQAQSTTKSAATAVVWQYNVNGMRCQQSWRRISQLLATTEATAASVATQQFLSKLFVAIFATAFATAFACVSIMQLAILSRLRQQRRSLSMWPHHNGFYVKPLTSAANSNLLASILASKISVTYLWRLSTYLRNILCINICGKQTFFNNQNRDFSEYRFRGSVGINSILKIQLSPI